MKRVIVTGGSGKLGRAVVDELIAHGYETTILDCIAPRERKCPVTLLDLSDFGQTYEALTAIDWSHRGVDAIVHLAAIPAPGVRPDAHTFIHNVACSFNVFQAAKHLKIKNLVWASSETLLGVPFDKPPPYVPVDEDYPARPEWSYALAKHMDEQMAAQFCRWDPELKMIGLRFSNVVEPQDYALFPSFNADPRARAFNLWAYIDARDGAQAVRLSLEYPKKGFEVFIIANSNSVMSTPNAELLTKVFPGVPVKRPFGPNESLLSIEKAKRLLGYAPKYDWSSSAK